MCDPSLEMDRQTTAIGQNGYGSANTSNRGPQKDGTVN
jgi:hypothetical protein